MKFPSSRFATIAAGAIGALVLAPFASATITTGVTGVLDTGVTSGESVTVSATTITFSPTTPPNITTQTGSPTWEQDGVPITATSGYVMSLTSPTTFPVNDYITITGTTIDYTLDGIGSATSSGVSQPGSTNGTNCASLTTGESCVVAAGSPFLLVDSGSGLTTVILSMNGTVSDGIGGDRVNPWSGEFSTQLNETAAAIQSTELGGGSITSTHSGSFTASTVPEPTTAFLGLSGLLIAAGLYRRRSRRS